MKDVDSDTVNISDVIGENATEYFEILKDSEIGAGDIDKKMRIGAGEFDKSGFDASSLAEWKPQNSNAGLVEWNENTHTFTLSNLAKKGDGSFYPEYCLVYTLKLKDKKALLQQALANTDHTLSVENTATWNETGLSDSAKINFKTVPLKKEIIGNGPDAGNNYTASFKLMVNPDGLDLLSGSNMLLVEDQLENMRLDISTVMLQYGDGEATPVSVNYSEETGKFSLYVENGKPVTITYDAKVLAGDASHPVNISNTASVSGGYIDEIKKQNITISTSGLGVGKIKSIIVLKTDSKDSGTKLKGAVFELYEYNSDTNKYEKVTLPGKNIRFITDKNGFAEIGPQENTYGGKTYQWFPKKGKYYLQEIKPPEDPVLYDYAKPFMFELNELRGSENVYSFYGDTINIKDQKLERKVILKGTKFLEGGTLNGNDFTFELQKVEGASYDGMTLPADMTAANDTEGDFQFNSLVITKPGTYKFKVVENPGEDPDPGIEYSQKTYEIEISLENNAAKMRYDTYVKVGDGEKTLLSPNQDGEYQILLPVENGKQHSFTNRVKKGNLIIAKEVVKPANANIQNDIYYFTVVKEVETDGETTYNYYNANGEIVENPLDNDGKAVGDAKIAVKAGGSTTVANLPIGTYTVTELDAGVTGYAWRVSVDEKVVETHSVTVTVEDRKTVTKSFKNIYSVPLATANVTAQKTLTGRALKADEFSFTLSRVSAVGSDKTTELTDVNKDQTVKNAQDGTVTFAPLTYTEAGTYTYKLKEAADSSDKATKYDLTEYLVEVVVVENELGALSAKVNYPNGISKPKFINKNRSLSISKTDVSGMQKLEGAHLQILDRAGAVVREWDTTAEVQLITGLEPGVYTLRETTAPTGYATAADTAFELNEDGTINKMSTAADADGTLQVRDERTKVSVRKTDIAEGTRLTGARLQILDANKAVIADWVSAEEDFTIEGLPTGVPFTLHEVTAPTGYELAEDTIFQLNADGTVNTEKTTAAHSGGVLLVEDRLVRSEKASITVVKTVSYSGFPLIADNAVFYAALYYDRECTKLAAPRKELRLQNAVFAEATFDNLEIGRTYYVGECDADGNVVSSGEVAGGTLYQARFTGTNGNRADITKSGNVLVKLDNEMAELPSGYYIEGRIHITKKVVDADGKPMASDDVFYAGIFEDPEHTKPAASVASNVLELRLGGGSKAESMTSVALPDQQASVTLYITEVDAQGRPVAGAPDFAYEVSVEGGKAVLSVKNPDAYVVITNKSTEEEETEIETETKIETKTETETEKKEQKSPRTGDETPILPMASALAVSALAILLLLQNERRRRARHKK